MIELPEGPARIIRVSGKELNANRRDHGHRPCISIREGKKCYLTHHLLILGPSELIQETESTCLLRTTSALLVNDGDAPEAPAAGRATK